MIEDKIESIEIYPYIVVYKNLYKDIKNTFKVLEESAENNEDRLLSKWSKWSIFGEYIDPLGTFFDGGDRYRGINSVIPKTENETSQKELVVELMDSFYAASKDYCKKYNIDLDEDSMSTYIDGNKTKTWMVSGPSIARYSKNYIQKEHEDDENAKAMRYHSDFIIEPLYSPGYKFAITVLTYFNDDYEGGEIEFAVGKKLIRYKPQAGDVLVFPSGNPTLLTEDGQVYIHAVLPLGNGNNKYLARMYWQKYSEGCEEWHQGKKEHGDQWNEIYAKMTKEFDEKYTQRTVIIGGVRVV